MITLRAKPLSVSLSDSPSIGFVATWIQNAAAYKELGFDRTDEISIIFMRDTAALEIWEYILGRKYDGKPDAIGTLVISPDDNIHEVTIGASEPDFRYLKDHFFELAENKAGLTIGLFLASKEQTSIGATSPFALQPRISLVLPENEK
ncbi:MAG: hypothetical protein ABI668_03820 [Sphingorhabdus sp.]